MISRIPSGPRATSSAANRSLSAALSAGNLARIVETWPRRPGLVLRSRGESQAKNAARTKTDLRLYRRMSMRFHGRFSIRSSQMPGRAHRLVDQPVGLIVADEALRDRIEPERPAQPHRDLGQVDDGAGPVGVFLVEGELPPRPDGLGEIGQLRLGIGKRGGFVLEVGDVGPESPEELSRRALR